MVTRSAVPAQPPSGLAVRMATIPIEVHGPAPAGPTPQIDAEQIGVRLEAAARTLARRMGRATTRQAFDRLMKVEQKWYREAAQLVVDAYVDGTEVA